MPFSLPVATTPPAQTTLQKQFAVANALNQLANQTITSVYNGINKGMALVWQNPKGLSPQEVFDALGSDAVRFVNATKDAIEFLNKEIPTANIPTDFPQPLTLNDDGTVTVMPS